MNAGSIQTLYISLYLRRRYTAVQVVIRNGKLNNFNEMVNDSLIHFVSIIDIKSNTNLINVLQRHLMHLHA